jgi:hypothetical protein
VEGRHVKGLTSTMASRRALIDRRKTHWRGYISTTSIRVEISGSNSPTEEITMLTSGSKSSKVEGMGDGEKSTTLGRKIEHISYFISSNRRRKDDR